MTDKDYWGDNNGYKIYLGVINNNGYIIIRAYWIGIEFSIEPNNVLVRYKYGNSIWSSWTIII